VVVLVVVVVGVMEAIQLEPTVYLAKVIAAVMVDMETISPEPVVVAQELLDLMELEVRVEMVALESFQ
jgi:hypothetical protein